MNPKINAWVTLSATRRVDDILLSAEGPLGGVIVPTALAELVVKVEDAVIALADDIRQARAAATGVGYVATIDAGPDGWDGGRAHE